MPTINQYLKNFRIHRPAKLFKPALARCPQKKALCLKIVIRSPKKPNSARRRTMRVLVPSIRYRVYCGIQGMQHNLQKWSNVLIRGSRRRDIPGVRYLGIRGKYDFSVDHTRRNKRSKHGMKRYL